MNKILWVDTETTGLSSKKNGLREVAYIAIVDGKVVKEDLLYINPLTYNKEVEIEDQALELSGKTIEDLTSYSDSEFSFDRFSPLFEYIDKEDENDYWTIAGYNTKFDIGFIKDWVYDNNCGDDFYKIFHYKAIDVFPLVITLKHLKLIDTENDKLETICKHFNIPLNAHNALSDIVATKELYELITDRYFKKVPTLREIEFAIRNWFIRNDMHLGYEDLENWFSLKISTKYGKKCLTVYDERKNTPHFIERFDDHNADQIHQEAYNWFSK